MKKLMRLSLAATLALLISVLGASCSAPRTPEGFCAVMDKHKQRFETAMTEATSVMSGKDAGSLIVGLAKMTSALGDLQLMWNELAEVAPNDIRADVEVVRDTNQKQLDSLKDAASDPLGVLAGGLVSGLTSSGSYQRVNDYAADHCGSAPFVNPTGKP